jgi:hypothetical protein
MDTMRQYEAESNGGASSARIGHWLGGFIRRLLPDDEQ